MALENEVVDLRLKKDMSFCNNTPVVTWIMHVASKQNRVGGRLAKGVTMRM